MSLSPAHMGEDSSLPFETRLKSIAEDLNPILDAVLPLPEGRERRVMEAMRYTALDGGKRLRPFLTVSSADLFGVPRDRSLRAGAAVELVHCYSLVHDDLPAMDDDDLRRGRPTCHKAYDEATAILAGDGLLTQAFAVLAAPETHPDGAVRVNLVAALAQAAGACGMVGGQMIDLIAETTSLTPDEVEHLQHLKTGHLLAVACELGAIVGEADHGARKALSAFGLCLGAAFQIADDLLDLEASAEDIGKATGKDIGAGKATFVSLHGADRARTQAKSLVDQAVAALDGFGPNGDPLRDAAAFAIERRH
jgi:farnesyl diphosphate synthase